MSSTRMDATPTAAIIPAISTAPEANTLDNPVAVRQWIECHRAVNAAEDARAEAGRRYRIGSEAAQ